MEVQKLIFKLIDFDNRRVDCITIDVHPLDHLITGQNSKDISGVADAPRIASEFSEKTEEIVAQSGEKGYWDHRLMQEVKNFVADIGYRLADYRLLKKKIKRETTLVSIPERNRLKEVRCNQKIVCKFVRGQVDDKWMEMYDYSKIEKHYILTLSKRDQKFHLVSSYEIPPTQKQQVAMATQVEQKQVLDQWQNKIPIINPRTYARMRIVNTNMSQSKELLKREVMDRDQEGGVYSATSVNDLSIKEYGCSCNSQGGGYGIPGQGKKYPPDWRRNISKALRRSYKERSQRQSQHV